jgi:hypothetical protein
VVRYERRGPLIYRDGKLWRVCLSITGARLLTWRARRAAR